MSRNQEQYGGKYAPKPKNRLRPFYPIIGLIVAAIAGAAAYFGAAPLYEIIRVELLENSPGLPQPEQMELLVGVMIFLVIVMVFALIFAAFQPRKTIQVSEQSLLKEKQEKEREIRRSRERQRSMREKMRKANKDFDEI